LARLPRRITVKRDRAGKAARQGDLQAMLERVTAADNWSNVIHRCAWCKRVFDESGAYGSMLALSTTSVTTDGMCPPCGKRALAQVALRQGRLAA
jgi:hypothetical protein